MLIHWYKCKKGIDELAEQNVFKEPRITAFNSRGDKLMENIALSAAVYLDPRLHHSKSHTKLLGHGKRHRGSLAEDS